jgi:hypothetical protein
LNIICNRSFFLFWNDVSFVPVRVLHKVENILGRKHFYLPHAQTAIYDSKVMFFLKQGISHQLGRDAVVRFECENSANDVIINFLWKIFFSTLCKARTGTKLTSFQNKKWPITNYVQTQFSLIFSNISMIIMYYEHMTTQYVVRFFLSI